MKQKILGKSNIKLSAIIMGTWQAGKSMWVGIEDTESKKAMRAAYDSGINTFDTASAYGDVHSERIFGRTLADMRYQVIYSII